MSQGKATTEREGASPVKPQLLEGRLEITSSLLRTAGLLDPNRRADAIWSWRESDGYLVAMARASWDPDRSMVAVWLIDALPSVGYDRRFLRLIL